MVGFCEYLTITWFDDDAKFPIDSWNHYNIRGPRTNNHIEGYNLKLKLFLKSHPNIWKFILKIRFSIFVLTNFCINSFKKWNPQTKTQKFKKYAQRHENIRT